jgi:predicted NBD/HSP70 family sugar kinase
MFVGLDLHKNYAQAAVMDDQGVLIKDERIPNDAHDIEDFFGEINDRDRDRIIAFQSLGETTF